MLNIRVCVKSFADLKKIYTCVCPMNNDAPEGWMEIQRDDEKRAFAGDSEATEALAKITGYPWLYYSRTQDVFIHPTSVNKFDPETDDIVCVIPVQAVEAVWGTGM